MVTLQDPIYRPNYYLSLMEFRDLTLRRLQKFVDQRFFSTFDYLRGECCLMQCYSNDMVHITDK